jgi:hypothetical protein
MNMAKPAKRLLEVDEIDEDLICLRKALFRELGIEDNHRGSGPRVIHSKGVIKDLETRDMNLSQDEGIHLSPAKPEDLGTTHTQEVFPQYDAIPRVKSKTKRVQKQFTKQNKSFGKLTTGLLDLLQKLGGSDRK